MAFCRVAPSTACGHSILNRPRVPQLFDCKCLILEQPIRSDAGREPQWSVVSTFREPAQLVVAFACYHLAQGAQKVHLFFDLPDDPAARVAQEIPGVEVTLCDAGHWAQFGYRSPPRTQTKRQTLNANYVFEQSRSDWLLHVDADEFLWLPQPLGDELAQVTDAADWLHIPNIERCWLDTYGDDMFEGVFRGPMTGRHDLAHSVYGQRSKALSAGLGGYSAGKAMARRGKGFLAIHKLRDTEGGVPRPSKTAESARILHFDGITPRHWAIKNLRYAAQGAAMNELLNRERMATIGAILRAPDPERAAVRVHEALYRLDHQQARALADAGLLYEPDIDIAGAVAKIAPHLDMDFSAAGFDRLHARELSLRSQAIVRQKRRATRRVGT